ncbi:polysaccharide deacetylase family protein [Streptomyces sp. NPDC008150]|uniref:polysaccharide deacetylase family protein n=1 Tax=Streptomyces sp. NPDC008150 TaxID=3364816 RepID=UPI0036F14B09
MSSSRPIPLSPEAALKASMDLVARRRGVPMLVSLRSVAAGTAAAPSAAPTTPAAVPGREDAPRHDGVAGSVSDRQLAELFEEFHARLAPEAPHAEAGVVAALQALAYTVLGPDGATLTADGTPAEARTETAVGSPLSGCRAVGASETAADLRAGNFLRLMNYHNTPASWQDELVDELRSCAQRFGRVDAEALEHFALTGTWRDGRAGLLPVFYEGYRDNYDIAAAACEEAGVTGWFFVCTQFVDTPADQQHAYASSHRIKLVEGNVRGERIAMSWEEIADLRRRGHVVTPHTASHAPARDVRTPADVEREVTGPKRLMDRAAGGSAPATAWLEGTSWTGASPADEAVRDAGYRFLFGNTMVQYLRPLPR